METGLDREKREGEPEHPRIIGERPRAGEVAGPGAPGPGGVGGSAGPAVAGGPSDPSSGACTAT